MEMLNVAWSNAFTVMGLGLLVVFIVLILLVFLLDGFGWFFIKKEMSAVQAAAASSTNSSSMLTAAEEAAVTMALHLFYNDVHDEESNVITIQETQTFWNSKIYNLNNLVK